MLKIHSHLTAMKLNDDVFYPLQLLKRESGRKAMHVLPPRTQLTQFINSTIDCCRTNICKFSVCSFVQIINLSIENNYVSHLLSKPCLEHKLKIMPTS